MKVTKMLFQPRNFWDPQKLKSLISFKVKDCGKMCFSMLDFAGMNVESVGRMFETPWNHYIVSRFGNVRLKSHTFIRFTNIYLTIPWVLSNQTTVHTARHHHPPWLPSDEMVRPSPPKRSRGLSFWPVRNGEMARHGFFAKSLEYRRHCIFWVKVPESCLWLRFPKKCRSFRFVFLTTLVNPLV